MDSLFPQSYEASRTRYLREAEALGARWSSRRLERHVLKHSSDLSMDWLWAEPHTKENLVMISTAEHGIEGYMGSAVMKVFMEEFAPRLNPEHTGLLLLHAINPWGMQQRTRVNPNNVDLNRNFLLDDTYNTAINPDYDLIQGLVNPKGPVRALNLEALSFLLRVIGSLISPGQRRVQAASLLGQHRHPKGIYYGGAERQEETAVVMELYQEALTKYRHFIQVDLHTGYGPRDQMTIIVPPLDSTPSAEAMRKFNYPLVQKVDPDEFYAISGDMEEYVYRLRDAQFPDRLVFAGGFEFGTFGDSLLARIRSLRATVLENQIRQHGAVSAQAREQVQQEYEELFFPRAPMWRAKALADSRQAFEGILRAFGLL